MLINLNRFKKSKYRKSKYRKNKYRKNKYNNIKKIFKHNNLNKDKL